MRLSTNGKGLELCVLSRVNTLLLHHLIEAGQVGRDSMNGCRTEVLDKLDLAQRVACSCGYSQHAKLLGSILETKSASKHAVARRVLEDVIGTQPYHPKVTCHLVCPFIEVVLCMQNDGWVASCAATGMQTNAVSQRHSCQSEGIGVAKVLLSSKGQFANVSRRFDVLCLDAHLFELLGIERHIRTSVDCLLQTFCLQFVYFLPRERLVLGMKVRRFNIHGLYGIV